MNSRIVPSILIAMLSLEVLAQQKPAASVVSAKTAKLTGTITDGTNPVVGAGVSILLSKSREFVTSTIAERTGQYEIEGLTVGIQYWVKVCHPEFTMAFMETTVPATANMQLSKRTATRSYWKQKADSLIAGHAVNDASVGVIWAKFEKSAVSPEGKAYVASELKALGAQPNLWDAKESRMLFTAYANADPATLNGVEEDLWLNRYNSASSKVDPALLTALQTNKATRQPLVSTKSPSDRCSNP